ncbi:hypothetical protein I316_04679 [Kwoniella heveanensis BCC8398]|uniref:Uncharacterized protein n=1 Tax=Kwoniella heveanensis BCC8398 TaxID=1296120 RepID=A0A1B9GRF7_9TREE|nr:hypothetical protein I316_04679 [Kwoniella heveanensis BCC8398]
MTSPVQCGVSTVKWSGDDGPYHLLLTPTAFKQHGYNVWIDSIADGTNSLELNIRLPAGLQFLLTMWGASGISYAATSDVMTVQPNAVANTTCFLSDQEILNLYSFSFNITNSGGNLPPQCSNFSMSWPTSLESNVTSDYIPRDLVNSPVDALSQSALDSHHRTPDISDFAERDTSSSVHDGNTTHPPTMFGIIPLGNSFSIPITYRRNSKYAKYLPDSSLSDNPTTSTSQGITHLNWTVDMAKGTRFIIVAGIGSQMKWASGGSSSMFTVGQGSTGCVGSEQGGSGAPSVTASSGDSPTAPVETTSGPSGGGSPLARTVVASVCSVVGTLVIVGLVFMCCRARRRRQQRVTAYSGGGKPKGVDELTSSSQTPLDLIQSRDRADPPPLTPLITGNYTSASSTVVSPTDPFADPYTKQGNMRGHSAGPSRSTTIDDLLSPTSPIRNVPPGTGMHREHSQDALLAHYPRTTSPTPLHNQDQEQTFTGSVQNGSANGGVYMPSRRGPLTLHDSSGTGTFDTSGAAEDEPSDLKRDTIAILGEGRGQQRSNAPRGASGSSSNAGQGRRRRNNQPTQDETEFELMVHRDAGRVQPDENGTSGTNVLELPPRYDEVNWAEEERLERERQTR